MWKLRKSQERALERQRDAIWSGIYICPMCGAKMEFIDDNEEFLNCPSCGYDVDSERYGFESEEDYDDMFPGPEEFFDDYDEEEDEDEDGLAPGEYYEEVCGELDDD